MSAASQLIHLPKSLASEAERLAGEDGISLEHWVSLAVAHKIGSVESTQAFFAHRARRVSNERMRELLAMAPDVPPMPGDELPEGMK